MSDGWVEVLARPLEDGTVAAGLFNVSGTRVVLADFGDLGAWDGGKVADTLKRIVDEHRRMMGGLPFKRYVFLNAFRGGAGGLEHLNSSLLSSRPNPTGPLPTTRWLNYASHEFFHAINVKRLRPIELGPFDYDRVPRTPSLWLSEGVTTYYADLAVVRAGVASGGISRRRLESDSIPAGFVTPKPSIFTSSWWLPRMP